jgi:hypothetical protein
MQTESIKREKFVPVGENVEGTITDVEINEDPFHCTIKILPLDPVFLERERRYSKNNIDVLRRHLEKLKFKIDGISDMIEALDSLKGRICKFKCDKFGVDHIVMLKPLPNPVEEIKEEKEEKEEKEYLEIYLEQAEESRKSIWKALDANRKFLYFTVRIPQRISGGREAWVLNISTKEEAEIVLKRLKDKVRCYI